MSNKKDCTICCSSMMSFDITQCPFCDIEVCKSCIKTFIIGQEKIYPECMSCKKILTRSAMVEMFGNTYFLENQFKDHIKKVMYAEEKMRIPEILPIVAAKKDFDKRYNECIAMSEQLNSRLIELQAEINNHYVNNTATNNYEFYKLVGEEICIRRFLKEITNKFCIHSHLNKKIDNTNLYSFSCHNPDCLGNIKKNGICDVCDRKTCIKCFIYIGDADTAHKCKKEDIETADFIKKNSKPCPKCGMSIMHAGGCSQMWCANCHYVFDWETGVKESGNIHNPEYFRYMRDNNLHIPRYRNNNNPCANIVDNALIKINKTLRKKNKVVFDSFDDISRVIYHINDYTLRLIDRDMPNVDTRELRYRLVMKEINEKTFKIELAKNYKKRSFLEERRSIVSDLRDILQDEFVAISNMNDLKNITVENATDIIEKLNKFIKMAIKTDMNVLECYGYSKHKNLHDSSCFIPYIALPNTQTEQPTQPTEKPAQQAIPVAVDPA